MIDTVKRWFREFGNPALKCARVGHDLRDRTASAYLYPPARRLAVADRVTEVWQECARCNHATPIEISQRVSLDGLTLDTDRWDILRRDGRLAR